MATSNLTADVPLYIFPDSAGGYKIGINVSLNSGQTYQMYEFDTGGQGFWSAYNASWLTNPVTAGDTVATKYLQQRYHLRCAGRHRAGHVAGDGIGAYGANGDAAGRQWRHCCRDRNCRETHRSGSIHRPAIKKRHQ